MTESSPSAPPLDGVIKRIVSRLDLSSEEELRQLARAVLMLRVEKRQKFVKAVLEMADHKPPKFIKNLKPWRIQEDNLREPEREQFFWDLYGALKALSVLQTKERILQKEEKSKDPRLAIIAASCGGKFINSDRAKIYALLSKEEKGNLLKWEAGLKGAARKVAVLRSHEDILRAFNERSAFEQELLKELQRSEKFRGQSLTDKLTGLPNYRAFLEAYEAYAGLVQKSAPEENFAFYLVKIDLNSFKQINDTAGHDAGDQALKFAARVFTLALMREDEINSGSSDFLSNVHFFSQFQEMFRSTDFLARVGGDEFVMLVPCSPDRLSQEALKTKIESALSGKEFVYNKQGYCLSASVGIVLVDSGSLAQKTPGKLYVQADALMYEDKKRKKDAKKNEAKSETAASLIAPVLV